MHTAFFWIVLHTAHCALSHFSLCTSPCTLLKQLRFVFLSHSFVPYVLVHFSSFSFSKGEPSLPIDCAKVLPPIFSLTFQRKLWRNQGQQCNCFAMYRRTQAWFSGVYQIKWVRLAMWWLGHAQRIDMWEWPAKSWVRLQNFPQQCACVTWFSTRRIIPKFRPYL